MEDPSRQKTVRRATSALIVWGLLFVYGCSDALVDYSNRVSKISNLESKTKQSLLQAVDSLAGELSRARSTSNRMEMLSVLASQLVTVEFAPPSRQNTPDDSIEVYSEFLLESAEVLKDEMSPEQMADMLLGGMRRFDREYARVDEWTHRCFPSPEDWGFPPETEGVLACLKKGDTNGVHASPQVRKMLRGMSSDLRERFPGIVAGLMNAKEGGHRALNYKSAILDQKGRFEKEVNDRYLRAWSKSMEPSRYEIIRRKFQDSSVSNACSVVCNIDPLQKNDSTYVDVARKIREVSSKVRWACTNVKGTNGVVELVKEVSSILDEYYYVGMGPEDAVVRRTSLVAPFTRAVEGYWIGRTFDERTVSATDLQQEIERVYTLSVMTVDLVYAKVGNYNLSSSLDINIYATLKWLAHGFERKGWTEGKVHIVRMMEDWVSTRYDVSEGNPLKAACERVEFYAARHSDRDALPLAVRSRVQNLNMEKALREVGRYPKWAESWLR